MSGYKSVDTIVIAWLSVKTLHYWQDILEGY